MENIKITLNGTIDGIISTNIRDLQPYQEKFDLVTYPDGQGGTIGAAISQFQNADPRLVIESIYFDWAGTLYIQTGLAGFPESFAEYKFVNNGGPIYLLTKIVSDSVISNRTIPGQAGRGGNSNIAILGRQQDKTASNGTVVLAGYFLNANQVKLNA